jgi:ABC-type antimicrobial peptide transport system permease subunit
MALVRRSLRHFWRTHVGVVLGAACATAVLVGALAVGDSVRLSLGEQARNRIGRVDSALVVGERYFHADLAERVKQDLGQALLAPVLQFQGIVRNQARATRAGIVDVFGVDQRFFELSPRGNPRAAPAAGQALVNERLAAQLAVQPGDSILLRIEKPSMLPRDMLMATIDDISFALRLAVGEILGEDEFGRFGLRASQVPPLNLFVSLPWLQKQLDLAGRANVVIAGGVEAGTVDRANVALRKRWTLADAGLHVRDLEGTNLFEMTSDRVFIDPPVVEAARNVGPDLVGVLTYFVNALRHDQRLTPYSMVTAVGSLSGKVTDPELAKLLDVLPRPLGADEIIVNTWLARDLQIKTGDAIDVDYFVLGPQLQLLTRSHGFRVRRVVPLAGAAADRSLMPAFPGLEDTENCRDWEPGIPIDLDRIRDIDEKYWDDHRGTPKAFLGLATGRSLFQNRYGSLTAVRGRQADAQLLAKRLQLLIEPQKLGLFFQDIRGPALAAGTSATDFGGLFLGLSFFLIIAALLLTALLFAFGIGQRANEIGLLLAVGFRPKHVRRLFLGEALILATIGSILGAVLGMGYTQAVLHGLGTLWRDAVGVTTLKFHARPGTIVMGAAIGVLVAVFAIWFTLRKVCDHPAVVLLQSRNGVPATPVLAPTRSGRSPVSLALAVCAPVLALALVIVVASSSSTSSQQAAGAFFGAGALLLVGTLAACRLLLTWLAGAAHGEIASVTALGMRNTGRRRGRSLATIALLASGTFLVVAVQANRLEPPQDPSVRASGTGGFALFGRSTLPVLRDLGSKAGLEALDLSADDLAGAAIVPMRVRDGDDASCLNLSLPQNPRLLGVQPKALADRGAFVFKASLPPAGHAAENPWQLLNADYGDDVVPAIGDAASVTWILHKKVGDTIPYRDEQGRDFRVRIVGTVRDSILQGNLVVAEERLQARFPSASGYRMFLIDAAAGRAAAIASNLTLALADIGFEVTSTKDRLADFNAVQNTYLLIFQLLGGLGLLLGSVGVGMVVLRNTLERRSELAVLSAVGYPARAVRRLVWSEHGVLLGLGLLSGVVAALLAVLPGARGGSLSLMPMVVLVVAVAASGALWVFVASTFATRGSLLGALREE